MSVNQLKQFGATSGYSIVGGGTPQPEEAVVDPMPQEGSTNPVASGGVYSALATKQDILTFDSTPTDDSTNPVTSDGIYSALQNKVGWVDQGILGAKNLLKSINSTNSEVISGVTFTTNLDGSVTCNGTNTSDNYIIYRLIDSTRPEDVKYYNDNLAGKTLILSGTPEGAGQNTYFLEAFYGGGQRDYGDGVLLTMPTEFVSDIYIAIYQGVTVNNLVFKPMLRLASDTDATYQPYAMTNQELTAHINKNKIGVAVDLTSYNTSNNKFTIPDDGYIVLNSKDTITGTSTATIYGSDILNNFTITLQATGTYQGNVCFVKKGFQTYSSDIATGHVYAYFPLN